MLSVRQLESGYGEGSILRHVSLEVGPGQVVCVMGRNGVGKTTLMKTIMGILKAEQGEVLYRNVNLTQKASYERAQCGIGYVPQGRDIFAQLTVYENLLLGLEANKAPKGRTIPEEALAKFPVLMEMLERRGGDLSGGQQQQLAIARALASKPDLLLLDEPTEGIQPSIVQDIQDVIRSLKQQGDMAIVLVEQSIDFVRSVADYYYLMDKGAIVAHGSATELDEETVRQYLVV